MKLYVFVRSDLSRSQQAVQAGHAVASWCRREARRCSGTGTDWLWGTEDVLGGSTLVYLRTTPEFLESFLSDERAVPFREPDMANEVTAVAILAPPGSFPGFRLV